MTTAPLTSREIAGRYDAFARRYALLDLLEPVTGLRRLRRRHLADARGRVLVVAAGTGMDLRALSRAERLVLTDISPGMLTVAARRAAESTGTASTTAARAPATATDAPAATAPGPAPVACAVMDAESLAVPDGAFDTVVSSLAVCTFPDPVAALREVARVCRPDGQVLLLEHGLSDRGWLARRQRRKDDAHARSLGCHVNRDPLALAESAGLRVRQVRRVLFGTHYLIHAAPQ